MQWIIGELKSSGGRNCFVCIIFMSLVEVGVQSLNLVEGAAAKVLIQKKKKFDGVRALGIHYGGTGLVILFHVKRRTYVTL